MPSGLIEAVRRANAPRAPEDSIALRAAVAAAVACGTVALWVVKAISGSTAALVVVALPVAYWVSYRRRHHDNWLIKLALAVGAILALIRFLGQIGGVATLDEIRFPLADLFLWVQILHSFDLPARKDLHFSLGSSLTLMAVAGSISQDLVYLPLLVLYFGCAITAMTLGHRSELGDGAAGRMQPVSGPARRQPSFLRDVGRGAAVTLAAAVILFLVVPQPSGIRTFALPFALGGPGIPALGSSISNPGGDRGDATSRGAAGAYYGLDERLDLRVRGALSTGLVMRVRSSAPAMWKGVIFDEYDGVAWSTPEPDPVVFDDDSPYFYPLEFRSLGPRATVTQTFYIEAEQASMLLAAGQPDQVWFGAGLRIDEIGGLRTDSTLTPGTVYSVVSSVGAATPDELRSAGRAPDLPNLERYLEVPESVPDRVGDLARRITRNARTDYDRVKMIERWLARNYRYSIDSPVPPEGRDAVDHFLFDTDVGFCEQFASATAIMLRTLGVPARVVAGYTPGTRNVFTGYYEVEGSDAHMWVEVWFPRYGWYEFDPTFAIPPAHRDVADTIPLVRVFRWAAESLSGILPGGGAARTALQVALVAVLGGGAWVAWRRLRPVRTPPRIAPPPAGGVVVRAFRQLENALAMAGAGRAPPETAAELLGRASDLGRPSTASALQTFERERYGPGPVPRPEADAAAAELRRIADYEVARGERSEDRRD